MMKKSQAINILSEARVIPQVDWSQNKDFIVELDERVKRYKDGVDRDHTREEPESAIEALKKSTK